MLFNNLPGQNLSDKNGNLYIISDSFSIIFPGDPIPRVYEWKDLSSIKIDDNSITINTGDGSYFLYPDIFESRKQFLTVKTLIIVLAKKAEVSCVTNPDLLPDKSMYIGADIPANAIYAKGEYNIKDIKSSLLLLLVGQTTGFLWTVGILCGLTALLLMNIFIGFNEDNWWFLLTGGFFSGVGSVALLYILSIFFARVHYASIFKSYQKYKDSVTFAICDEGFSACESDVYSPTEIIRWNKNDHFIETASMFIVTRKHRSVLWVPKALFDKDEQSKIADILALNLSD